MDEEIFGEGWKHLSKSKIFPKRKTTYRLINKLLFRKKGISCVYMYVYNISGGVANIFYKSCAQIDNTGTTTTPSLLRAANTTVFMNSVLANKLSLALTVTGKAINSDTVLVFCLMQ
jgi:hypothetical protein